jgi:hypothetical protein
VRVRVRVRVTERQNEKGQRGVSLVIRPVSETDFNPL